MDRTFELERGRIDMKTGEFPLRLMTNGEASDGHIVDIKTLVVPESIPMFVNHDADPVNRMGQMHSPRKSGKSTRLGGATLHMIGRIDLEGDSALADIRRDVAQGIHVGDVRAMSGRWDGGEVTARSALDKGHYAYSDMPAGWDTPSFFEGSTMKEGSIVGLGADDAALIGRAGDAGRPQHVRDFYSALLHGQPTPQINISDVTFTYSPEPAFDLEEIELECGSRVLVPVEVARVWGQSVEEPDDDHGSIMTLRKVMEAEEGTIQPEPTDSDEARPDSTEPRAELSEALDLGDHTNDLEDLQEFMRDREVFRAARNKARTDKFLFETLGRIPDGD